MIFMFFQVDLRHKDERKDRAVVNIGIDLTEFYQSVEWDILSVPAQRFFAHFQAVIVGSIRWKMSLFFLLTVERDLTSHQVIVLSPDWSISCVQNCSWHLKESSHLSQWSFIVKDIFQCKTSSLVNPIVDKIEPWPHHYVFISQPIRNILSIVNNKANFHQKCQVLHLLWRALPGHHLQHHDAEEDAVLHSQPDHPLHGHLLPHCPRVLSSLWQRGEGITKTFNH